MTKMLLKQSLIELMREKSIHEISIKDICSGADINRSTFYRHYKDIYDVYEQLVDEEKGVYNEDGSLNLNPNSLQVVEKAYLEPAFADAKAYDSFQFVRNGFYCVDAKDSTPEKLVFNRIVSLKSSFKLQK